MKSMIVTGFMPFGGEEMNPAWEAAARLPDELGGARIVKLRLPVSYARSWEMLKEKIGQVKPDALFLIGQAGGRAAITAERYGRNEKNCASPDCDGELAQGVPVVEGGEDILASAIAPRLIPPFDPSDSAGGYVCNCLYYNALHFFGPESVFVHVPYCELSRGIQSGKPYLPMDEIARQIEAAVTRVAEGL